MAANPKVGNEAGLQKGGEMRKCHCHFCLLLLDKATHKAGPDSRGEELVSPSDARNSKKFVVIFNSSRLIYNHKIKSIDDKPIANFILSGDKLKIFL